MAMGIDDAALSFVISYVANKFTEKAASWDKQLEDAAKLGELPDNNDLSRAARRAYLETILLIIKIHYQRMRAGEAMPKPFTQWLEKADRHIRTQIKHVGTAALSTHAAVTKAIGDETSLALYTPQAKQTLEAALAAHVLSELERDVGEVPAVIAQAIREGFELSGRRMTFSDVCREFFINRYKEDSRVQADFNRSAFSTLLQRQTGLSQERLQQALNTWHNSVSDLLRSELAALQEALEETVREELAASEARLKAHMTASVQQLVQGLPPLELPRVRLDPRLTVFGREGLSREVFRLLKAHGQVQLHGTPGIGKSTLLRSVGMQAAARYPGGVVLVDLRSLGAADGGASLEAQGQAVVGAVLNEFFPNAEPTAAPLARHLLAQETVLLLLDNLENPQLLDTLLRELTPTHVLVASRMRMPITTLAVPLLSAEDALALYLLRRETRAPE